MSNIGPITRAPLKPGRPVSIMTRNGQTDVLTEPRADPAAAWQERAEALADWAWRHLVNRADAYGQYLPLNRRDDRGSAFVAKYELTPALLERHFQGRDVGDLIGLFSTTPAEGPDGIEVCRWLGIDIDRHDEEGDPAANQRYALLLADRLRDFYPLLLDSNGAGGYHISTLFKRPRPTAKVFAFGKWLVRDWAEHGLAKEPETFPKQATLGKGKGKGFGNWLRLPGRHHTRDHWTRAYDLERGIWCEGDEAIRIILAHRGTATPLPGGPEAATPVVRPAARNGKLGQEGGQGGGPKASEPPGDNGETDRGDLRTALESLPADYRDNYDRWIRVGMALSPLGDDGLALWDRWSQGSVKYEPGCCAEKWPTFEPGHGLTPRSVFHWAQAAGWRNPASRDGDEKPEAEADDLLEGPIPGVAVLQQAGAYETREGRLGRWELIPKAGWDWVPLANFDARVVEEVSRTIGAGERKVFTIRATRPLPSGDAETRVVEVDAEKFDALGWVTAQLGAAWAIPPGRNRQDQLREGIQRLSALDGIAQHVNYAHTGWIRRDGLDYYLHAGGAIGAAGAASGFRVELARLAKYELPPPCDDPGRLREAVRASLRLLQLGKSASRPNARGIAATLAALPWRAVLRPCSFAVSLVGGSGSRKTTTACLALQHFAPRHTFRDPPPASWASTAAQVEFLLHTCKDALLVIDNFIADGPDQAREQAKAAAVFNNQGDQKGRARMRPDMTPMPELPPQGAILSTGEDGVLRRSAKGRSLIVKFTPESRAGAAGSIDLATLTDLQRDADAGLYAIAMASYIRHVARDRAGALAQLAALAAEYSARAVEGGVRGHARTPGILAELAAGFRLFAEWAASPAVGAVEPGALAGILDVHWAWLASLAGDQQDAQDESDDARRFVELVTSALGTGRAHLVDGDGRPPKGVEAACGWTRYQSGVDPLHWDVDHTSVRIGWLDGGRVYLDADEAARLTQAFAAQQHKPLSNPDTVVARLAERGWLAVERTGGKTRYRARKTLEGVRRTGLLAFDAAVFWPADDRERE
jgi:hypothetical protein